MRQLIPIALLLTSGFAPAQPSKPDWSKWWPQFRAAVAKHDGKAVAQMMQFPVDDWELGQIRKLTTAEDFAAHFDRYFPADMVKAVATKKPEGFKSGEYSITWKARGDEYSLYFREDGKGSYVLWALSEGPA